MKNPQTLAKELAKIFPNPDLQTIANYGCCAFVLQWALGIEQDGIDAIITVQNMRKKGVIKSDCSVKWYEAVPYLIGRPLKEVKYTDITTIKNIKKRTIVLYAKEGNAKGVGHWVGVENGRIKYNPLKYSENVEKGKPVEMRELIF